MVGRITFLTLFLLAVGIFIYNPEIDIYVSSLFYNHEQGFYLKENPIIRFFYYFIQAFFLSFLLGIVFFALKKFLTVGSINVKHYKKIIYVLLVIIIGPGFIVHNVLKDNVGRPRPHQIENFGGSQSFKPPFAISKACIKNCSFVSGHASVGFMMYAIAFLYKGSLRKKYMILGTVLGLGFGFVRVIQGAHFLSDVIFAGITVFLVSYVFSKLINPTK